MRPGKPFLLFAALLLSCSLLAGGGEAGNDRQGNKGHALHSLRAAYGISYNTLSAGWGISYRVDDNYYHQYVIDLTKYRSTCLYRTFKGYGAQLTFFRNGQYSFGLKYYTTIRRFSGHTLIPYVGISPSCFVFKGGTGVNCKPFVGVSWNPFYHLLSGVDINFNCAYGYDIPFIHAKDFTAGRHDLSATVSIGIKTYAIAGLFRKNEDGEKGEF